MSDFALTWAVRQEVAGRYGPDILLALANLHTEGGFCVETKELARLAGHDTWATVCALWDLRNAGLIRCENIGGLMPVKLACDFPGRQEAAE